MNDDVLKGQWKQLRGRIREKWGQLTDDELDMIQGRKDILVGKIQERYGYTRDEAAQEVDRFLRDTDYDTSSRL
jgi:uncharacterized protein YjbJ (UPF0337 family)